MSNDSDNVRKTGYKQKQSPKFEIGLVNEMEENLAGNGPGMYSCQYNSTIRRTRQHHSKKPCRYFLSFLQDRLEIYFSINDEDISQAFRNSVFPLKNLQIDR